MTSVFARICIGVIAPSMLEMPIHSAKIRVTPMSVATGRTRSLTLPSSRVGKFRLASPGTNPWEVSTKTPSSTARLSCLRIGPKLSPKYATKNTNRIAVIA
jgi:hypothetical protein